MAGAEDLVLKSILAISICAANEGNKLLAISKLNVVKDKLDQINNPLILQMYKNAQGAISQLGESEEFSPPEN